MSKSVRGYLRDIKAIYQKKSEEVEKKYNELKKAKDDYVKISSSKDFTPEGRQKRLNANSAYQDELKHDLDALRREANEAAGKIRNEAEKAFYGYYNAKPEDVDLKMLELIRSGVLSEKELIHYGERANTTMRRLIGKELEKKESYSAHQAATIFQMGSDNPHLKAIDEVIGVGDYAVGGAPMGGYDSVSAIRARFDSLVDPVIANTRDVSVSLADDGSESFTIVE